MAAQVAKRIFITIRGRRVPITVRSRKLTTHANNRERVVEAIAKLDNKTEQIGRMYVQDNIGKAKRAASVIDVKVQEYAQNKGVGSAIFEHAKKLYGRAGFKALRSSTGITSPAQVQIRAKHHTKFYEAMTNKYGEPLGKKLVSTATAKEIVADTSSGRQLANAATLLNKTRSKRK